MKAKPPKRIWIRSIQHGRISICEYNRNRAIALVEPFNMANSEQATPAYNKLRVLISEYARKEKRPLVAKIYFRDENAKDVARILGLPIEY